MLEKKPEERRHGEAPTEPAENPPPANSVEGAAEAVALGFIKRVEWGSVVGFPLAGLGLGV